MQLELQFQLPSYEGPLDLLLDLIRKQEIDIYDIPIAKITSQYLDYTRALEELDINLGGEFILMAATLIHIKSKLLLPPDPEEIRDGELLDPREELVQQLLEHEKFKNAAQMLQQKAMIENAVFTRQELSNWIDESSEQEVAVTLYDLVVTFSAILERVKLRTPMEIVHDEMTIGQMIEHLRLLFERSSQPILLTQIFESYTTRRALIVTFLALLELVRLKAIHLLQKETFGPIFARKQDNFENAVATMSASFMERPDEPPPTIQ
ncbi:MAG: segregation/condensation protein A [Acidobacteriia bacterium]|nr:segregation/condensation protein A [Terriglobia bacterium]